MASNAEEIADELQDEIKRLENLRLSTSHGIDLCQLYSDLVKLKCHFLETSIPEIIPTNIFTQLVHIRWIYKERGWDSIDLDRSLKRGMRQALEAANSESTGELQISSILNPDIMDMCRFLLRKSNPDEEWGRLDEMFDAASKRFGRTAGRP